MNYKIYFKEKWEELKKAYNTAIEEGRTTYEESTNMLKFIGEEIPSIIMQDLNKFFDLPEELQFDNRSVDAYIESYFIYANEKNFKDTKTETYIPEDVILNNWYNNDEENEKTR